MTRAVRIDKLTLAGFEAVLMEYVDDEENVIQNIPTLRMLLQKPEEIKIRADKIARRLKKEIKDVKVGVTEDTSRAGGGSLPEKDLPTYTVSIRPDNVSINDLEERLRKGDPPIIARIKEDCLIIDARTIMEKDIGTLVGRISAILS